MLAIGIDTGVHTGFAVWDTDKQKFIEIDTLMIHQAWKRVLLLKRDFEIKVYFEDARLRKWFGNNTAKEDRARLQGAGSVKRDANIWEDFLADYGIEYEAIAPVHNRTKLQAQVFAKITGWKGRTSEHSRDAAMLVFGKQNQIWKTIKK